MKTTSLNNLKVDILIKVAEELGAKTAVPVHVRRSKNTVLVQLERQTGERKTLLDGFRIADDLWIAKVEV